MRYERNAEVVYRNGLMAGLLAGFWCLFPFITVGAAPDDARTLIPLTALGLWFAFCTYVLTIRPRVVLRQSEAEVIGYFFGSETVPYAAIRGVGFTGRFAGSRWLQIKLDDGSIVGVHPFMATSLLFVDPPWQEPLAVELNQRAKQASRTADVE